MIFGLKTVLTEKLSNKWEFVIWIKQTKMSMSVYMPAVLRILLLKRYLARCLYRIVCGWSTNRKPIIPKLISKNTIGHIFSLYIIYNGKRPLFQHLYIFPSWISWLTVFSYSTFSSVDCLRNEFILSIRTIALSQIGSEPFT